MRKEVRMTRKHNWNSFRSQRSWAKCQDHVVDISRATLERFLYSLKINFACFIFKGCKRKTK